MFCCWPFVFAASIFSANRCCLYAGDCSDSDSSLIQVGESEDTFVFGVLTALLVVAVAVSLFWPGVEFVAWRIVGFCLLVVYGSDWKGDFLLFLVVIA